MRCLCSGWISGGQSKRDEAEEQALALGLLTLLAFSNSFSTGFALDNQVLLLGDTRIQSATAAVLYRPLTMLSYLLNYAILGNGGHPAGYHWINFFLYAANVFLLFAWETAHRSHVHCANQMTILRGHCELSSRLLTSFSRISACVG